MAAHFDLDRIVKSPAKFDRDKLLAFNLDAIQDMSEDDFVARFRSYCESFHPDIIERFDDETFSHFARANKERSKTLLDPIRTGGFFLQSDDDITWESIKPVRKALCNGDPCGYERLEAILPVLRSLEDWTVSGLESAIDEWAAAHADGNLGKVAQPIRVAVSGGPISPPIYDTLVILGKDSSLRRMERCLEQRSVLCPSG